MQENSEAYIRELEEQYNKQQEEERKLREYADKEMKKRQNKSSQEKQKNPVKVNVPKLNIPTIVDYINDTKPELIGVFGDGKYSTYIQTPNQQKAARQKIEDKIQTAGPDSLLEQEKNYYLQTDPEYQKLIADRYTGPSDNVKNTLVKITGAVGANPIVGGAAVMAANQISKNNNEKSYLRDVISTLAIGKNTAEVDTYLSDNVMLGEKAQYIDAMKVYADNYIKYLDLQKQYESLSGSDKQTQQRKSALLQEMGNLLAWNNRLQRTVEEGATYDMSIDSKFDTNQMGDFATNRAIAFYNPEVRARRRTISDTTKDLVNVVKGAGLVPGKSISESIKDRIISLSDEINNRSKDYDAYKNYTISKNNQEARRNIKEIEEWKAWHTPSKEFKAKEEAAQDNYLTNMTTYTHGMWGVIGSSSSFMGAQLLSTGLDYLGMGLMYAPHPAAKAAGIVSTIAGAGVGILSGDYENRAEVTDNYIAGLTESLKREGKLEDFLNEGRKQLKEKGIKVDEDKDVFTHFLLKDYVTYDPVVRELALRHMFGANNVYQNDMMAVSADVAINAGLNLFGPTGTVAESMKIVPMGKFARLRKFVTAANDLPFGSQFVKNVARAGGGVFGDITKAMSPAAGAIYKVTAGALKPITKHVEKGIQAGVDWAERALGNALHFSKMAPDKLFKAGTAAKYIFDFGGRVAARGFSEGIEEGKQYIYGKKFANGEFAGESNSMLDTIIDDLSTGTKTGLAFIGNQFFGLQADRELLSNMRGGFIGGIMNHGTVISAVQEGTGIVREMKAGDAFFNMIQAQKLQDRSELVNGVNFARYTSAGGYRAMMDAMDRYESIMQNISSDETSQKYGFSKESIDKQRQAFQRIYNYANSRDVIEAAKKRGIKKGSDKFNTFISLLSHIDNKLKQNIDDFNDAVRTAESIIGNYLFSKEHIENLEKLMGSDQLTEEERNFIDQFQLGALTEEEEKTLPTFNSNRERNRKKNKQRIADAFKKILAERIRRDVLDIRTFDSAIARGAAFTRLIQELEDREEFLTDAEKFNLKSYKQQFQDFMKSLTPIVQDYVNAAMEDLDYAAEITNPELFNDLSSIYRTLAQHSAQIQQAEQMRQMLVGDDVYFNREGYTNDFVQNELAAINNRLTRTKKARKGLSKEDIITMSSTSGADALIQQYENAIKDDQQFMIDILNDIDDFQSMKNKANPIEYQQQPEESWGNLLNWKLANAIKDSVRILPSPERTQQLRERQIRNTSDYSTVLQPKKKWDITVKVPEPPRNTIEYTDQEADEAIRQIQAEYEMIPPRKTRRMDGALKIGDKYHSNNTQDKKTYVVSDIKTVALGVSGESIDDVLVGLKHRASRSVKYIPLSQFNEEYTQGSYQSVPREWKNGDSKAGIIVGQQYDLYSGFSSIKATVLGFNKNDVIIEYQDGTTDIISIQQLKNAIEKFKSNPLLVIDDKDFTDFVEEFQAQTGQVVSGSVLDTNTQLGGLYNVYKNELQVRKNIDSNIPNLPFYTSRDGTRYEKVNYLVDYPYEMNASQKQIERIATLILSRATDNESYNKLLDFLQDYYNGTVTRTGENADLLDMLPKYTYFDNSRDLHLSKIDLSPFKDTMDVQNVVKMLIQDQWLAHGNASLILRTIAKDALIYGAIDYSSATYDLYDGTGVHNVSELFNKRDYDDYISQLIQLRNNILNSGKIIMPSNAPIIYNGVATDIDIYTIDRLGNVEYFDIASSKHNLNDRWDKNEREDSAPIFDDRYVNSSRAFAKPMFSERKETRRQSYNKHATPAIKGLQALYGSHYGGYSIIPIQMVVTWSGDNKLDLSSIDKAIVGKNIPLSLNTEFEKYLFEKLDDQELEDYLNKQGGLVSAVRNVEEQVHRLQEILNQNFDFSSIFDYLNFVKQIFDRKDFAKNLDSQSRRDIDYITSLLKHTLYVLQLQEDQANQVIRTQTAQRENKNKYEARINELSQYINNVEQYVNAIQENRFVRPGGYILKSVSDILDSFRRNGNGMRNELRRMNNQDATNLLNRIDPIWKSAVQILTDYPNVYQEDQSQVLGDMISHNSPVFPKTHPLSEKSSSGRFITNQSDFVTNGSCELIYGEMDYQTGVIKKLDKQSNTKYSGVYAIFTYNGTKYAPVLVQPSYYKNSTQFTQTGQDFVDSVIEAQNKASVEGGKVYAEYGRLIPTVYFKAAPHNFVTDKNINISDDELRELSASSDKVGIVNIRGQLVPMQQRQVPVVFDTMSSDRSGELYYLMEFNYLEYTNGGQSALPYVPIKLIPKKLNEDDKKVIIKILQDNIKCINTNGYSILNKPYRKDRYDNDSPFTNKQILDFYIKTDVVRQGNSIFHIDQNGFVWYRKNIRSQWSQRPLNMESQFDQQEFLEFLNGLELNINTDILSSKLTDSRSSIFKNLKQWVDANGPLEISSNLRFDETDVDDKGFYGIGWSLRHGRLQTNISSIAQSSIYINGPEQSPGQYIGPTIQQSPIAPVQPVAQTGQGGLVDMDGLFSTDYTSNVAEQIKESDARKVLQRILGKSAKISIIDDIIGVLNNGAKAVGMCTQDAIVLSRYARSGTEYHEAFHRIFELVLDKKDRQKYQTIFLKQHHNINPTDSRQIAEAMADEFLDFIKAKQELKFTWNIKKLYTRIKDFIDAILNIGSIRLISLYYRINKGKYADRVVSDENKTRFETEFKSDVEGKAALFYSVYNPHFGVEVDLPHIPDWQTYNDAINTVVENIIMANGISLFAQNARQIDLSVEGIQKMGEGEFYKSAVGEDNSVTPINAVFRDIFNNWQYVMPDVARALQNHGLPVRVKRTENKLEVSESELAKQVQETNDDKVGGEYAKTTDIGNYIKESWEMPRHVSIKDGARFFFSTIFEYRYVNHGEVDEQGNPIPYLQYTKRNGHYLDVNGNEVEQTANGSFVIVGTNTIVPQEQLQTHRSIRFATNSLGYNKYVPFRTIYNLVLNRCHDAKDPSDLLDKFRQLATEDDGAMFLPLWAKYKNILDNIDYIDEHGTYISEDGKQHYIKVGNNLYKKAAHFKGTKGYVAEGSETFTRDELDLRPNYNNQSIAAAVFNAVSSQKLDPKMIRSTREGHNQITFQVSDTDMSYTAQRYSQGWANAFLNNRSVVTKREYGDKYLYNIQPKYLTQIADNFKTLMDAYTGSRNSRARYVKLDGNTYDLYYGNEDVKKFVVSQFNKLGISIDMNVFNMLLRKISYGKTDINAMRTYFSQAGQDFGATRGVSMFTFIESIRQGVNEDGQLSNTFISGYFYTKTGLITQLADAKYEYNQRYNQTMLSIPGDNKMYSISNKNPINRFCEDLNTPNSRMVRDLLQSRYHSGSEFLQMLNTGGWHLEFNPAVGYRSDARSDRGSDYMQINDSEDFVQKISYLMDNMLPYMTMSDKKTYGTISLINNQTGVRKQLAGIKYIANQTNKQTSNATTQIYSVDETSVPILIDKSYNGQLVTKNEANQNKYFILSDDVYNRFMWYALSEREAVVQGIERNKTIPENERVVNFDTAENGAKNPASTAFARIYGVWVTNEKGEEEFINFNDNSKTPEENLKTADDIFFKAGEIEKKAIITKLIMKELQNTLDRAENLGLIQKTSDIAGFFGYENIALDKNRIDAIVKAIAPTQIVYGKDGKPIIETVVVNGHQTTRPKLKPAKSIKSLAVVTFLLDTTIKHIIAEEEIQRLFVGHPGEFKIFYNSDSRVTDDTQDLSKRLGGYASTGEENCPLKGVPEDYVCSELKDYRIGSPIYEDLKEWFKNSTARHTLYSTVKREIAVDVETLYPKLIQYAWSVFRGEDASIQHQSKWITPHYISIINNVILDQCNIAKEDPQGKKLFGRFIKETLPRFVNDEIKLEIQKQEYDKQKNLPLADVLDRLDGLHILEKVEKNAENYAKSFAEKKVNVADGASYASPEMIKWMLQSIGLFNGKVAKAWRLLQSEDPKPALEVAENFRLITDALFGTQKYTSTGYRMNNGYPIFYYNKTAIFPMFRQCVSGKMLDLYKLMQDQGVHLVMMESAVKFGGQGAQSLPMDDSIKSFVFNKYKQKFRYFTKQLNTDPKESETMSIGSQAAKVIISVADKTKNDYVVTNKTTFQDVEDGFVSGEKIQSDIFDSMKGSSRKHRIELLNRFKTDGVYDLKKLSDYLLDNLSERDADQNMLQGLRVIQKNGDMYTKVSFSALSNMGWVQSIVASYVNKNIIDINLPGSAFIQRSVFGMDGGSVLYDNEQRRINGGKKLNMKNEDGSMDAIISIDYFYSLFPHLKNMSFDQAREWLIKNQVIGENAKTLTVGYRIPTQAVSSIHALKFVDVIGVSRDTIILPEEFVAITGSDFDIDKLFLSTKWMRVGEDGNVTDAYETTDYKNDENIMLDRYLQLLMQPGNKYAMILSKSIDNDTAVPRGVAEETTPKSNTPVGVYESVGIAKQTQIKSENRKGKEGIGPYALNNNSEVLTQICDVCFENNGIVHALGMTRMYDDINRDSDYVLSNIGGCINGNVDIAKGSWVSDLNFGSYTYDLSILLIRTGMGKRAFYFTKQPIVKELQIADEQASGYLLNEYDQSSYFRREQLFKQIEKQYFLGTSSGNVSTELQRLVQSLTSPEYTDYTSDRDDIFRDIHNNVVEEDTYRKILARQVFEIIQQIVGVNTENPNESVDTWEDVFGGEPHAGTILQDVAVNHNKRSDITDHQKIYKCHITNYDKNGRKLKQEIQLSVNDVQFYVYICNKLLQPYIYAMQQMVQYSKIDTKKQGNSIAKQLMYRYNFLNVFGLNQIGISTVPVLQTWSLQRMATETYIYQKTMDSIQSYIEICNAMGMIEASPAMTENWIFNMMRACGLRHNGDVAQSVMDAIMSYIKYNFIYKYAKQNNIDIKGLFVGDDSMYNRLGVLKQKITTYQSYSDYIDYNGSISNKLLNLLDVCYLRPQDFEKDVPKFIEISKNAEDDIIPRDVLISEWDKMLKDNMHPDIQEFARDLVVYAFITSGDTNDHGGFFNCVPDSWRIESGYSDYMQSVYEYAQDEEFTLSDALISEHSLSLTSEDDLEVYIDILRNKWYDNNLVPTVAPTVKDSFGNDIQNMFVHCGKDGDPYLMAIVQNYTDPQTGERVIYGGSKVNNLVVKVKKHDANSTNNFDDFWIYRYVKHGSAIDRFGNIIEFPIYALTSPRGGMFYGHKMIQYQQNIGYSWENIGKTDMNRVLQIFDDIISNSFEPFDAYYNSRKWEIKELMVSRDAVIKQAIQEMFDASTTIRDEESEIVFPKNDSFAVISKFAAAYEAQHVKPEKRTEFTGVIFEKQEEEQQVETIDVNYKSRFSNFTVRPFEITQEYAQKLNDIIPGISEQLNNLLDEDTNRFNSVEQVFHLIKLIYLRDVVKNAVSDGTIPKVDGLRLRREISNNISAIQKLDKTSITYGRDIKRIGDSKYYDPSGTVNRFFSATWPAASLQIEHELMFANFTNNTSAAASLVNTGDVIFTHTVGRNGHEKTMPQTLMEIREYLKEHPELYTTQSEKENKQILNSDRTILSNSELKLWNERGVGEKPRILVASEHTDPAFHVNEILKVLNGEKNIEQKKYSIISKAEFDNLAPENRWYKQATGQYFKIEKQQLSGKDFNGLYIITKHDGLPMKKILETKIPKLIHFSITSLGNTEWEPGVMKYNDMLDRIQEYIEDGLDPESVTIRIDPIVPGVTRLQDIEEIIKRGSEMGIKRFRFSVMDIYKDIIPYLKQLNYDTSKYYNQADVEAMQNGVYRNGNAIHATAEMLNAIADEMLKLKEKYNIELGTCAEPLVRAGISREGCLSVDAVNRMLGTSIEDLGTENNKFRKECSCYGNKTDVFAYNSRCASHCLYCYARHQSDAAMKYYDEDGKLLENEFTRTRDVQQSVDYNIDTNTISDKTEAFGVEVHDVRNLSYPERMSIIEHWKSNNPLGIVAYRKKGDNPESFSPESVQAGWIGNPFSTQSKGSDTVQNFYDWIVSGNNFGNTRATEQFRQAIINKILNSSETTPIWYYTELNRPSHATIIGYLIRHKELIQKQQNTQKLLSSDYIMTSGGAPGGDATWGYFAVQYGIPFTPDRQMHFYTGEKGEHNAPYGNVHITPQDYNEGRYKVAQAAAYNWGYNKPAMVDDRLIRNWAQVKYADAIFAVGSFANPKNNERLFPNIPGDVRTAKNVAVKGGTGYAVTMAIFAGKPVYVYDQERKMWARNINGQWEWLNNEVPTLTKRFAGIGTRNINQDGINAIREVFEATARKDNMSALQQLKQQLDGQRPSVGPFTMAHIKKGKRPELEQQVQRKNPRIAQEDLKKSFDFLESLPNTQEDNAYVQVLIKWLKNDAVRLPDDDEKIRNIFDWARSHNIDITKFKSPLDLFIQELYNKKLSLPSPPNIDKYTTFHRAGTAIIADGSTVDIYDIEDTAQGQQDVCQFLADTNPQDSEGSPILFSPWCISCFKYDKSTGKAKAEEGAIRRWSTVYNNGRRAIAVLNGYPIAMCSSAATGEQWWDYNDHSYSNIRDVKNVRDARLKSSENIRNIKTFMFGNYIIDYKNGVEDGDGYIVSSNYETRVRLDGEYLEINWHAYPSLGEYLQYVNSRYISSGLSFSFYMRNDTGDVSIDIKFGRPLGISFRRDYSQPVYKISNEDFELWFKDTGQPKPQNWAEWFEFADGNTGLIDFKKYDKFKDILVQIVLKKKDEYNKETINNVVTPIPSSQKQLASPIEHEPAQQQEEALNNYIQNAIDDANDELDRDAMQAVVDNYNRHYVVENEYTTNNENEYAVRSEEESSDNITKEQEDAINTAEQIASEDETLREYNERVRKPISKELQKKLRDILKKYHFDIIETSLDDVFGEDELGKLEILEKLVYLSTHGGVGTFVEVEEFSHAFIELMGSAYHKQSTRESNPEMYKLYSELRDMIEQTAFYKQVYEEYKDVYVYENGSPNEPQIKKEALGKALAASITKQADKYNKKDKSFFTKLKQWFDLFLSWFKSKITKTSVSDGNTLQQELDEIANSILDGTYQRKYLFKDTMKGKKRQDYYATIENDIRKTGGVGLDIMQTLTRLGCVITGSISYRAQGTVYRSDIDTMHDIDVIVPNTKHDLWRRMPLSGTKLDNQTFSSDRIIDGIMTDNEASKIIKEMKQKYPGFDFISAFPSDGQYIVNCIICNDSSLRDKFKSMSGNFTNRLHQLTQEERDSIWLIDLFFKTKPSRYDYKKEQKYNLNIADYRESFEEKLKMGRAKDVFDYQHWSPFGRDARMQANSRTTMSHFEDRQSTSSMRFDPEQLRRDGIERKKQCK